MLQELRTATFMLIALTILTGGVYPFLVTVIAQVAWHEQAQGSLLHDGQRTIGSKLIGQAFSSPDYFWGRLSATGPMPYNAASSNGSNRGPLHPELKSAAETRIAALSAASAPGAGLPVDLVTASASGLDPHISPAGALFQVARVAASRKLAEDSVRELVRQQIEGRQLGILGEPRVNVLRLNMALDQLQPRN